MIFLNGSKVKFGTFPNGETSFDGNIKVVEGVNRVYLKYTSDADLIQLLFLKRHLDRCSTPVNLYITYMPYSRQDRVEGASVFTLKYIAEFINALKFKAVLVVEPHSDVTMALLDNADALYPTITLLPQVMMVTGFDVEKDYIFFPDAGAMKRYAGKLENGEQFIVGVKQRNFATGRIDSLRIAGTQDLTGRKVIIVDDLCSKGGTFAMSADKLKARGATQVFLLVAHCEETIFDGELLKDNSVVDMVYCTDSMLEGDVDWEKYYKKIHIFKGAMG